MDKRLETIVGSLVIVGAVKALVEQPLLIPVALGMGLVFHEVEKWLDKGQKSPQQLS